MNVSLNPSAQIYTATLWGKVVGFIAVLHFPHPHIKNMKKISRVVVLPDYQGVGIGKMLMQFIAKKYTNDGFRVTITTSHPAINKSMKLPWVLLRQGRVSRQGKSTIKHIAASSTRKRMTCSWEYKAS